METPPKALKILIVDGQQLFSDSLKAALLSKGMEVYSVSGTKLALQQARQICPDLALLDITSLDGTAESLGRSIIEQCDGVKVVGLTDAWDVGTERRILNAGFAGYLSKQIHFDAFLYAIGAACSGELVVSSPPDPEPATQDQKQAAMLLAHLTQREMEVLELLAEGSSQSEIAHILGIASNTARTHVQNILVKLQVHSRLQAVAWAHQHGIIKRHLTR